MSNPNILWQPQSGPQTIFCERPEFEVVYGGAKGGGKTDVLLMEGLRQIDKPRYHAGFFRRTYKQLQEVIDRSHVYFPRIGGKWQAQLYRWLFPSGARYDFCNIEHEDDKEKYQGWEFHYLAFDQLEQFTESQYDYILMQVRTADSAIRTYIRGSANPGGIGHGWVKGRWISEKDPYATYKRTFKMPDGKTLDIESCFIPAKVYDNKILLEANPLYLAQLMGLPAELRKAMLEGNWDVYAGQFFDEWREEIHAPFPKLWYPPVGWRIIRAYDSGYVTRACCKWYAVSPDGWSVGYREYYPQGVTDPDQVEQIRLLSRKPDGSAEDVAYTVGDPACWQRKSATGISTADVFTRNGVPMRQADNDRILGWRALHEWLKPFAGEDEQQMALLRFTKSCANTIRCYPALISDDNRPEDVDTDGEDHPADCDRYFVMSRPRPADEPKKTLIPGATYTPTDLRMKGYSDAAIRRMARKGGVEVMGRLP